MNDRDRTQIANLEARLEVAETEVARLRTVIVTLDDNLLLGDTEDLIDPDPNLAQAADRLLETEAKKIRGAR